MIAGRIPGRTANDVKNYWNTHIQPRSKQHKKQPDADEAMQDATLTLIKTQPHTISNTLNFHMNHNPLQIVPDAGRNLINEGANSNYNDSSLSPNVLDEKIINQYLNKLLDDRQMEIEGWSAQLEVINAVDQEDDTNTFFQFPTVPHAFRAIMISEHPFSNHFVIKRINIFMYCLD